VGYAQVLSDGGNWSIVQLPERKFPGVVVQGDSLSILVAELASALAALQAGNTVGAEDELAATLDQLSAVKRHYEAVLGEHGIELPYST
jgi:hypothetical protein